MVYNGKVWGILEQHVFWSNTMKTISVSLLFLMMSLGNLVYASSGSLAGGMSKGDLTAAKQEMTHKNNPANENSNPKTDAAQEKTDNTAKQ